MQIKKPSERASEKSRPGLTICGSYDARAPQASGLLRIAGRRIQLFVKANAQAMITSSTEKLRNAFVKALGVSPDSDFESMAYGQTPRLGFGRAHGFDQRDRDAFDIMLATDDVIGMSNFLKAKEIVVRNGVSFT